MRPNTAIAFATIFSALVCGCDRGEGASANASAAGAANEAVPVGERVAALHEGQRKGVFIRAIRDANFDCQGIRTAVRADDYRDMPVWTVTCSNGTDYTVVIPRSGVAQVFNADEYKLVEK